MPPVPNQFASHLRDYEYRRLGTVSLLAGLDLHTGRVTEIVSDHHASADFIGPLGKLNESYPARSMLRGICVSSKQELVDRIPLYFEQINTGPVIFRWKYKMDEISIG